MGMANKAPTSQYSRKRYVARHAIERLRERLGTNEAVHRPDNDLANWVDRAVEYGIYEGKTTTLRERTTGDRVQLVELDTREFHADELFAVVKPDDVKAGREAIVTVLSREMVERYKTERWKVPDRINSPFGKLLGAMPSIPKDAVCDGCQEVSCECTCGKLLGTVEPQRADSKGVDGPKPDPVAYAVTYRYTEGTVVVKRFAEASEAADEYARLIERADVLNVEVWSKVEVKITRTVTVEVAGVTATRKEA